MNIQARYDEVYKFNDIAENLNNVTLTKLEAQMKVFIEESKETADAFTNKDSVELLDGICDSFVTLVGLMQMADKMGFKVDEALKRVNENNLEKYIDEGDMDDDAYDQYIEMGRSVNYNSQYQCYVLKDSNLKIRKPIDFVPVQIDDLVVDVFGGAA